MVVYHVVELCAMCSTRGVSMSPTLLLLHDVAYGRYSHVEHVVLDDMLHHILCYVDTMVHVCMYSAI